MHRYALKSNPRVSRGPPEQRIAPVLATHADLRRRSQPGRIAPMKATLGGAGFRRRAAAHVDEVRAGRIWSPCGYRSEIATLEEVLLAYPPDTFASVDCADDHLMLEPVDLGRLREQAEAIAEVFRSNGVEVRWIRAPQAPPNVVFARDLFFMTPAGAVVARTAATQRAGEERYAAAALADAGFPIVRTVSGTATFEGADALWLDPHTVLVGTGFRTNGAGKKAVREALEEQNAEVVEIPLRPGVQHLLGAVVFLNEETVALHEEAAPQELRELLKDYRLLELPPDDELLEKRAMNVVTLAPGHVLMPSGCPRTRRRFERAGIQADEVDVGEYIKAAGGPGCLTGIVRRGQIQVEGSS